MEELDSKTQQEITELYEGKQGSYLIFSVGKHRYALNSSLIKEIMYGVKIHGIPFTPDYIEGVLNCRGVPFTVVNLLKMAKEENSDIAESVFLLFNRDDDQFCLHISNIEVFFEPEEDDILEDKVKYKFKFIPLFNADKIEETLCKDLGKDE
ncbi:MAG: chemotaxis protein CheW [Treponema sp.]|jgi:chemotaxis signal transduction protein|nr:chemotaxis protein CheW [Treponema sp.]MBR7080028.1 chemotaxis protein CheW [Treponema sp.]